MRKLFIIVLSFVVASCAPNHSSDRPQPFSLSVQPAVAGEENTIVATGIASSSSEVSAVMRMPDMDMPPVRVQLQRQADGRYVASGVDFSMSGTWAIVTQGASRETTVKIR